MDYIIRDGGRREGGVVGTLDKVIGPAMLALLARAITEARFGRYVFGSPRRSALARVCRGGWS